MTNERTGRVSNSSLVNYTGSRRYRFEDVEVIPLAEFLRELHQGSVF